MKYKITISEITEKEIPETEYQKVEGGKDEAWDYVETGKMKIERSEREIYQQELEDLDLGELVIFINGVREKLKVE